VIAALVALVPAAVSAIYAWRQSGHAKGSADAARDSAQSAIASVEVARDQLQSSQQVAFGQLLLSFDALLLQFLDVHAVLHPRSEIKWSRDNPPSAAEQIRLELYMGLFERMWLLVERQIVPADVADRLYRYRILNIVANEWVRVMKLRAHPEGWRDFLEFCKMLQIAVDPEPQSRRNP
jgi:hypothetical protein